MDKACFQHDTTYNKYKNLEKRIQSDKVLKDKDFKIEKTPEYNGYEHALVSMVYRFFQKKFGSGLVKNTIKENQQLANEIHKPIIRKFKKRKVYSSYKDNIWGYDLADMELIAKYNKKISIYCVFSIFLANMLGLFL